MKRCIQMILFFGGFVVLSALCEKYKEKYSIIIMAIFLLIFIYGILNYTFKLSKMQIVEGKIIDVHTIAADDEGSHRYYEVEYIDPITSDSIRNISKTAHILLKYKINDIIKIRYDRKKKEIHELNYKPILANIIILGMMFLGAVVLIIKVFY